MKYVQIHFYFESKRFRDLDLAKTKVAVHTGSSSQHTNRGSSVVSSNLCAWAYGHRLMELTYLPLNGSGTKKLLKPACSLCIRPFVSRNQLIRFATSRSNCFAEASNGIANTT
ncbi:hypothetical protein OUZ56_021890 [Daphnia magna]|uniref:Uncharacterized protein n=1 Tax=Daphnia magna TaxID=35525 RepID=A0ABR0AUR5_9CRUS|nr:hypothetical protein OUZ56_021890 [Daphnia magna]